MSHEVGYNLRQKPLQQGEHLKQRNASIFGAIVLQLNCDKGSSIDRWRWRSRWSWRLYG